LSDRNAASRRLMVISYASNKPLILLKQVPFSEVLNFVEKLSIAACLNT
jgi:hypothetical protein